TRRWRRYYGSERAEWRSRSAATRTGRARTRWTASAGTTSAAATRSSACCGWSGRSAPSRRTISARRDKRAAALLLRSLRTGQQLIKHGRRCLDGGREALGTRAALEDHFSVAVDHVDPIRPPGIGFPHRVIHRIDEEGNRPFERFGELLGDLPAFFQGLGLRDVELVFLHVRMGFADVDDVDVSLALVVGVQFLDLTDRGHERRSGAAAEEEHDGLAFQLGQLHGVLAFRVLEREVRRGAALF